MQRVFKPIIPARRSPDFNWFEYAKESLASYNPDSHCCQRCGKLIWAVKYTATYRRGFFWPYNGRPVYDEISIPVVLCEGCGRDENGTGTENGDYHHAIFCADVIIPFTPFTLPFILEVINSYVNRTGTVADVCEQWEITATTLYNWLDRYKEHYDLWVSDSFKSYRKQEVDESDSGLGDAASKALRSVLCWTLEELPRIISGFFSRLSFSFLQACKKTHLRELPKGRRPRIIFLQ